MQVLLAGSWLLSLVIHLSKFSSNSVLCHGSAAAGAGAGADPVVEEMQNEAAVDEVWSSTLKLPAVEEDHNEKLDEDMEKKFLYFKEMLTEKVFTALRTYGYQAGQPWGDNLQSAAETNSHVIADRFGNNIEKEHLEAVNGNDPEDGFESIAKSVIHLTPVADQHNTFQLELQNISATIDFDKDAELLLHVPENVRKVIVSEKLRRRSKLIARKINGSGKVWRADSGLTDISIMSRHLKKWKQQQSVHLLIEFETALITGQPSCKPPYLVFGLLPRQTVGSSRLKRSSHCNIQSQYVHLSNLFNFVTIPTGLTVQYCGGPCASVDRMEHTGHSVLQHMENSQVIPRSRSCCVPTDFKMLQLMVILSKLENDEAIMVANHTIYDHQNTRVIKINIPNLSANHCGCV